MVHQLVVGRAQQRVARVPSPARAVDEPLRMFDAKSDRKGLGLDVHAARVQHLEGVARTVSERQHHVVGAQRVGRAASMVEYLEAANLAVFDQHVGHALLEADLAAERDDLLAHAFDHLHQLEGADVRVRDVEDLGRRAGLDEFFHHLAAEKARVLDLAVELAV